jgi:hypothetical protein
MAADTRAHALPEPVGHPVRVAGRGGIRERLQAFS